MIQKVILTGASGFVGQNLTAYLTNMEIDVKIMDRDELISHSNLEDADAIIHLAGKAHDLKKTSNPKEYYEVNYELTKRLYNSFLQSNINKFIFISSVKAVADSVDEILTEEIIPNPKTDYGKSKLMAEQHIQSQSLPMGKSYYILRPCMIHGPGNKGNLNLLYKFVKKGLPYPLAAFENKRSYLSIQNFCFVISRLLGADHQSDIYNLADDESISTNEVVSILANSSGKKAKFLMLPKSLIRGIAKFGDIMNLPLNTERLEKLTENYVVSNKKLYNFLGSRLPITSEQGLRITANSFFK